jgi:DNA polymerase III delta prime subunit
MAALRAKKPEPVEDRLKLLLAGPPGCGKTTAATQFPHCYFIDTERGANKKQYTDAILAGSGVYFGVDDGGADPDEVLKEVEALTKTRHEYRTLVIDSFTTLFEAKQEEAARKVGTDYGKHTDVANRWAKQLFRLLTMLDMNVVVTSHVKDSWAGGEKGAPVPDGFKKASYLFDLVLMLDRVGTKRIAMVEKTRYSEFPDRDRFEWSYGELERRWGQVRIEREAVPVKLASAEEITTLKGFFDAVNLSDDDRQKFIEKNGAEKFEDLTAEVVQGAIERCRKQLQKVMGDAK